MRTATTALARRWFALGSIALSILSTRSTGAQNAQSAQGRANDVSAFRYLQPPSEFLFLWPKESLYEGTVSLPVPTWSRTEALTVARADQRVNSWRNCLRQEGEADRVRPYSQQAAGNVRVGCSGTFTPRFVIRQLNEESAPVRRPTFNPHFKFDTYRFTFRPSTLTKMRQLDSVTRPIPSAAEDSMVRRLIGDRHRVRMLAGSVSVGHYSNGQKGCWHEIAPNDSVCRDRGVRGPLNEDDGSFSVVFYAEPGVSLGRFMFAGDGTQRSAYLISTALRFHLVASHEQQRDYGRALARSRFEYRRYNVQGVLPGNRWFPWFWRRNVMRATVESEQAIARRGAGGVDRGSAMLAIAYPALGGAGVMTKYSWGWDGYNIGFRRPVDRRLAFGVIVDHASGIMLSDRARRRAIFGQ
jgi:hypothetical protein